MLKASPGITMGTCALARLTLTNDSWTELIYICGMETTDLKSKIGIAEMSPAEVVKILDKRLANDYLLFTKSLHSGLRNCYTSLLGGDHYD